MRVETILKRFLSLTLIINFLCMPVYSFELDTSVDDEIRRNYNPSKLEDDMNSLPPLPKILDTENLSTSQEQTSKKKLYSNSISKPNTSKSKSIIIKKSTIGNFITLKKGTKVKLKLQNTISDRTRKGTRVTFVSQYPVTTTYFTIPTGTIFQGEILRSHKPQFTGNGGLIIVRMDKVFLNNETQPITARVTKANRKKIFLNKIKGKRKYVKSVFKSMKPGCRFCKKMFRVTGNLAKDGSSIIIAPFPFAFGVLVASGNIALSPVLGLFYKGDSIKIPENSSFEIKLNQDVFIYY